MAAADKPTDIVEIFESQSLVGARKIIDVLLQPEGIDATVLNRTDPVFPANGQPGACFVAVRADQADRARAVVEEAFKNGFLDPEEGEVIPPRP